MYTHLSEVPRVEVDVGRVEVGEGVGGVHLYRSLVVPHRIYMVLHKLENTINSQYIPSSMLPLHD